MFPETATGINITVSSMYVCVYETVQLYHRAHHATSRAPPHTIPATLPRDDMIGTSGTTAMAIAVVNPRGGRHHGLFVVALEQSPR